MSLSAFIGLALLAASADKGPIGVHVTTSTAAERIPLPSLRGPIELVVDPLGSRLELRVKDPRAALLAEVARHVGAICPHVAATASGVELRCRTRRFDAILSTEGTKRFLDIQELRGLPWREGLGGPPFFHYDPVRTGIGPECPGGNPLSRGECALLRGRQLEAATFFRSAIDLGDGQLAALRLGDLSLATGDPATAIGWYRRVGIAGDFGRLARTRICEIEGSCLSSTEMVRRFFNSRNLPDPLRAEMSVRGVRAEAFAGRLDSATRMLWQMIHAGSLSAVCREGGEIVCRRVLLEVMRHLVLAPVPSQKEEQKEEKEEEKVEVKAEAPGRAPAAAAVAATTAGTGTPTPTPTPTPTGMGTTGTASATALPAANAEHAAPPSGAKPAARPAAVASAPAAAPAAPTAPAASAAGRTDSRLARPARPATERTGSRPKEVLQAEELVPLGEPSAPEMAMEVYLSLPRWDHGPLAPELSEAAADLAKHIGAPVFGGNLLSAVAPEVGAAMLPAHLLRAAELYLEGDDIARTRLVIEYARTRIGKMSARWIAVEKKLAARVAREEENANAKELPKVSIDAAEIARELAAAHAVSARAHLARSETAPQKQGDKK